MKAYKHFVKHALAAGLDVTVWDGGDEPAERHCTKYQKIIDAIEAVEIAELLVYKNGKRCGWAQVMPFGLEDEETMVDYSVSSFFDDWLQAYERLQEEKST